MKKILTTILVLTSSCLFGQGFTYSYVDPCSRQVKTLQVTNSQAITVNYLGNINSFSSTDFTNGTFDAWVNQITAAAANQPCDELLTNTQVSQNMFITQNLISTLTSVTAASTMTASNAVSNSVSNSNSQSGGSRRGGNNNSTNSNNTSPDNQSNTSTDGTNNNSQGNSSPGSTTPGGGTQQGGSTSNNTSTSGGNSTQGGTGNQSGSVSQGGSGQTQRGVTPQSGTNSGSQGQSQGQSVSDGNTKPNESSGGGQGGTTNSVSNASESSSSSSGGNKAGRPRVGSIVGTGDIVAIRVNEDKSNQFRGTMSVTKSNTNNTKARGFLLNYTTTINNSNLTLYGAFKNKKGTSTFILANSSMVDFEKNLFNTTTALQSKTFGKTALMGGLNFTVGGLGGEMFSNISAVGGGFHPFKISKNLTGNILVLGVYSPFTKFYEGKWWDSGWLVVPFSSWDYAISKNFKYNVSFSGTYEVKGSILQFQILTGGKILL
jgi:hypothetical protein